MVALPFLRYRNFYNVKKDAPQDVQPRNLFGRQSVVEIWGENCMRFLHLSDLHLGKRVHNFSMIEDQKYILNQIADIAEEENVTGVIIAGDVYDKPVPSAEAVALFDDFLVRLAKQKLKVFVISGNHDSPERIAFGEKLMRQSNVYLSPVYNGRIEAVKLTDEFGVINVYLLPFVKPAVVRHFFEEEKVEDYTEAIRCAISKMDLKKEERNILVCHQFVTGATRSESEEISVGGLDNVDASVFDAFDYVALGHIHGPQNIGSERVRYCGTPLKYSFSEAEHKKSVTIVDIGKKGETVVTVRPLSPMRDLVKVKGFFAELTDRAFYGKMDTESYIQITLLDEYDIPNAFGKLVTIYPNLMQMHYENRRTMADADVLSGRENVHMEPDVLFSQFYEHMNNQPMTKEQSVYLMNKIEEIWGMGNETC